VRKPHDEGSPTAQRCLITNPDQPRMRICHTGSERFRNRVGPDAAAVITPGDCDPGSGEDCSAFCLVRCVRPDRPSANLRRNDSTKRFPYLDTPKAFRRLESRLSCFSIGRQIHPVLGQLIQTVNLQQNTGKHAIFEAVRALQAGGARGS